jgi:hypothetical protein
LLQEERHAADWLEILVNDHSVTSPADMCEWGDDEWHKINDNTMRILLKRHIAALKISLRKDVSSVDLRRCTPAEYQAYAHNIKRYFAYHASVITGHSEWITDMPLLSDRAVNLAIDEVAQDFEGDHLLQTLKSAYMSFCSKNIQHVRTSRGILLHGPPGLGVCVIYAAVRSLIDVCALFLPFQFAGTGKTTLTYKLPKKVGFTAMSPPLAAAEVNRSLVGQTEKLLVDLLTRAQRFPHLICSISIDEIDGLAPRRDEKSSQHKNDALSVLLSLIGGIKDVSNLVFMASTNRLKMMDEAFLRRMNLKIFVGRPGGKARRKMLSRVRGILEQESTIEISEKALDELVVW